MKVCWTYRYGSHPSGLTKHEVRLFKERGKKEDILICVLEHEVSNRDRQTLTTIDVEGAYAYALRGEAQLYRPEDL